MKLKEINKEIAECRKQVKLENVDCILNEKLKDKKFKKLYDKEVTFDNVDDMIDELGRHTGWTIWDYIVSYWHRYFWNYVSEILLRVKTFIQRGMRGWADSDTWCLNYYLATIISSGVQHLIKYGNSCWTKKDLASLKEIIRTFKTANEINGHNLIYTPSQKFTWSAYKKQKRTCKYMNKKSRYPRDKKYRVMTLREIIKFEKGFDTFKEKFFYLWD